jgi:hypothetical protein
MPEAPINEHRNSRTDEDEICSPSDRGYRPRVNPVSQATRMGDVTRQRVTIDHWT